MLILLTLTPTLTPTLTRTLLTKDEFYFDPHLDDLEYDSLTEALIRVRVRTQLVPGRRPPLGLGNGEKGGPYRQPERDILSV